MITQVVGQTTIRAPPDRAQWKQHSTTLWYSCRGRGPESNQWNHQTDKGKLRDCITRWPVIFPRVKVMKVVENPEELFWSEED